MKRVVFFGSIGLAKKCLEEIVLKEDVELLGVLCSHTLSDWRSGNSVYSYCMEEKIPLLTFDEINTLSPDIGISVRYNELIPEEVIASFKQGIINTHGGILPEYRGSYCNINALINGENEYGVTLHYISRGIDSGDIVAIKKVSINEEDTGFSLYNKSEQLCYEILKENIKEILSNLNNRITQKDMICNGHVSNTYYTESTLTKKKIRLEDIEDSLNIIRAFDSPYHEPAHILINERKIYLRSSYSRTK